MFLYWLNESKKIMVLKDHEEGLGWQIYMLLLLCLTLNLSKTYPHKQNETLFQRDVKYYV